jgi:hypothetical protein
VKAGGLHAVKDAHQSEAVIDGVAGDHKYYVTFMIGRYKTRSVMCAKRTIAEVVAWWPGAISADTGQISSLHYAGRSCTSTTPFHLAAPVGWTYDETNTVETTDTFTVDVGLTSKAIDSVGTVKIGAGVAIDNGASKTWRVHWKNVRSFSVLYCLVVPNSLYPDRSSAIFGQ